MVKNLSTFYGNPEVHYRVHKDTYNIAISYPKGHHQKCYFLNSKLIVRWQGNRWDCVPISQTVSPILCICQSANVYLRIPPFLLLPVDDFLKGGPVAPIASQVMNRHHKGVSTMHEKLMLWQKRRNGGTVSKHKRMKLSQLYVLYGS
jgi:hypothetical protein